MYTVYYYIFYISYVEQEKKTLIDVFMVPLIFYYKLFCFDILIYNEF